MCLSSNLPGHMQPKADLSTNVKTRRECCSCECLCTLILPVSKILMLCARLESMTDTCTGLLSAGAAAPPALPALVLLSCCTKTRPQWNTRS